MVKLNASKILTLLKEVAQRAVPITGTMDRSSSSSSGGSGQHLGLTGLLQLSPGDLGYAKLLLASLEQKLTSYDQVGGGKWGLNLPFSEGRKAKVLEQGFKQAMLFSEWLYYVGGISRVHLA